VELTVCERPDTLSGEGPTTAVAPRALHAPKRRWRGQPYLPYLVFTLIASIYLLPFMRLIFLGSDEGTFVDGAVRVLHGQVFARDFFEVMGPGTFYALAGFFKVFGATFLAARLWLFITSLGTGLLMYFLTRRVCAKYRIFPPILLVGLCFSTFWPTVNHHVDSNFFGLLSVVCVVLWIDARKNILLLAAGALAGVTTCILQPKGMLLLFAFLVWLCIEYRRRSAPLYASAVVVASYCGVIAAVLLYFWNHGALRDLLYMDFVWPTQNYSAVNSVPYGTGLYQFWTQWVFPIHGVRWLVPLGLVLIIPYLLVAALPVLVPVLGIPLGNDNSKPEILLYWFCGWAMWISEIHRRDMAHLAAGCPLLVILCVHFLGEYRGKAADLVMQLFAVSAGVLATINLFMALVAHSVPTRVGSVALFKPSPALTFLDSHVAPGTEIFVYPTFPMYYFLSDTRNPTRYSLLLYNYNTSSQFHDAIRALDQHKVRYVVWDTTFDTTAAPYFSESANRPAEGLLMEPYLESHYRIMKDLNGVRIMERKANDNAASQR
jgi:hypothetical protein